MSKVTTKFEFDYFEDKEEIKRLIKFLDFYANLWDLDTEIRNKLNYEEDPWMTDEISEYLEYLRDIIRKKGVLDD